MLIVLLSAVMGRSVGVHVDFLSGGHLQSRENSEEYVYPLKMATTMLVCQKVSQFQCQLLF